MAQWRDFRKVSRPLFRRLSEDPCGREVYVEITPNKNARTQFHIAVGNMQFAATEGRFDVKACTADSLIITAIDGDQRLDTGSSQPLLLHPHEQAQLIHGQVSVLKNVDMLKILAWKINVGKP